MYCFGGYTYHSLCMVLQEHYSASLVSLFIMLHVFDTRSCIDFSVSKFSVKIVKS